MKKLIIFLMIAVIVSPLMAVHNPTLREAGGSGPHQRYLKKHLNRIDQAIEEGSVIPNIGTGDIYYVDSGSGLSASGAGTSWKGALLTLDEAFDLTTANNGDIVYVAQNHAESLASGDDVDHDIDGVTVIGLGVGLDRPTFTFTGTGGDYVLDSANGVVCNLVFQSGIANVVNGIEVSADADGAVIEFCEFLSGSTDAYEFVDCIQVTTGADDLIIRWNKATETTAGAKTWLDLTAGIVDSIQVYGNNVYGDYSEAVINGDSKVHTLGYYGWNTTTNLNAADYSYKFTGNATGVLEYNNVYALAEATSIDAGAMACFENYVTTATQVNGMIYPATDNGSTQLNATTCSAIATAVNTLSGYAMLASCDTNASAATVDCTALDGYGDDYFNTGWSLVCIHDHDAPGTLQEGEIRDIEDYTSTGGVFTVDPDFSAAITANDDILVVRTEHLNPHMPAAAGSSSKNIWYCDDGGSAGDGKTWTTASITLKAAEALMAAGDVCYIGANHTEHISAADAVILNLAGSQFIGMGEGTTRPQMIMEDTAGEITLSAAGIILKNLQIVPDATVTASGIRVEAAGIGCTIENCAFVDGSDDDDEFVDCISVAALASNLTVKNCTYENTNQTAEHTNTFVNLDETTIDNPAIIGCFIYGDFAEAAIWSDDVPTNVLIQDNVITNTNSGDCCIEFQSTATGMCINNKLYGDTLGAILDPGSMYCYGNTETLAIDEGGRPLPDIPQKIDSIHGTGQVFYVDASGSNGGGRTWATAKTTLDAAVDLCTDDRGDTIYVAAGHTETVVADFADIDQGGITVIGLGNGKLRPYFDYTTGVGSSLLVEADDILIKNLWFHANISAIATAIEVKTGSLDVTIEDCLFTFQAANDEFEICIDHAAGNHGAVVKNCDFQMGAGQAVSAIHFLDADYAEIIGNTTSGDYSTAVIHNETTASDHIVIDDNIVFNGTIAGGEGTEPGIELLGTTSGVISNNNIVCLLDAPGEAIVALDCYLFNNKYNGLESSSGARDIGLTAGKTYVTAKLDGAADDDDLFAVAGGPIQITKLYGVCTVAIGAACTITIICDNALADVEYTDAVDINTLDPGGIISLTAANPSAIAVLNLGANLGMSLLMDPWYCPVGVIEMVDDGGGTTGNIEWYMTFIPLVDGVTVTPQ